MKTFERAFEHCSVAVGRGDAGQKLTTEKSEGAAAGILAARVAWPLWSDEQGGGLTRPIRRRWRREPADPATVERDGYDDMWRPARPGAPGAIPLVEFPFRFRR